MEVIMIKSYFSKVFGWLIITSLGLFSSMLFCVDNYNKDNHVAVDPSYINEINIAEALTEKIENNTADEELGDINEEEAINKILLESENNDQRVLSAMHYGLLERIPELWEKSNKNNAIFRFKNNDQIIFDASFFHLVLAHGKYEYIKKFIDLGIEDKRLNPYGLLAAMDHGDAIKSLFNEKLFLSDINKKNAINGKTPLMTACERGCLSAIKALFECNVDVMTIDSSHGDTILHCVAASGKREAIQYILDNVDIKKHINIKNISFCS